MTLASVYRKQDDRINFNVDWLDAATGTGYLVYYFASSAIGDDGISETGNTKNYFLTKSTAIQFDGTVNASTSLSSDGEWVLEKTQDFDIEFKKGVEIGGDFYFFGTSKVYRDNYDAGDESYFQIRISFHEYDGTNETEIMSDVRTSSVDCGGSVASQNAGYFKVKTNCPEYNIKSGNYLRVKIKMYLLTDHNEDGKTVWARLAFDPTNEQLDSENGSVGNGTFNSNSQIHIPIKQKA